MPALDELRDGGANAAPYRIIAPSDDLSGQHGGYSEAMRDHDRHQLDRLSRGPPFVDALDSKERCLIPTGDIEDSFGQLANRLGLPMPDGLDQSLHRK